MKQELLELLIQELICNKKNSPTEGHLAFKIGEKVFIRTVTFHIVGEIIDIKANFLFLKDAAWVADSGRFSDAIEKGTLNEVEPVSSTVRVNIDTIDDVYEWKHKLPLELK